MKGPSSRRRRRPWYSKGYARYGCCLGGSVVLYFVVTTTWLHWSISFQQQQHKQHPPSLSAPIKHPHERHKRPLPKDNYHQKEAPSRFEPTQLSNKTPFQSKQENAAIVDKAETVAKDDPRPHILPESGLEPFASQLLVDFGGSFLSESEWEWVFQSTSRNLRLQSPESSSWRRSLTAYLEAPFTHYVAGKVGSRGNLSHVDTAKDQDLGEPPEFVKPLPLRTQTPQDLERHVYPRIQTCHDVPGGFPTDAGLQWNVQLQRMVPVQSNVYGPKEPLSPTWLEDSLPYCPVDRDPFLPWIHDVFPNDQGTVIHVLAQNKRKCRTGIQDSEVVNRLTPQVALMQAVSVERISQSLAQQLAPSLWNKNSDTGSNNNNTLATIEPPRYRLIGRDQVRVGENHTRFVCRFTMRHATNLSRTWLVGETLSTYAFDYEYAAYRKNPLGPYYLLTPKGKDTKLFWTSHIQFQCPVPNSTALQSRIAQGRHVLQQQQQQEASEATLDAATTTTANSTSLPWWHGIPLLYVDVIPIRTTVRYRQHYLDPSWIGPSDSASTRSMNPTLEWGSQGHVVPQVEASGRWTNIPICLPPHLPSLERPRKPPLGTTTMTTTTTQTTGGEPSDKTITDDDAPLLAEPPPTPKRDLVRTSTQEQPLSNSHISKIVPRTNKKYFLSACLWASAEFETRGLRQASQGGGIGGRATTDTAVRLIEWLEFHLLVGVEHFFIYDNTGAHTNATSLYPLLFPAFAHVVTYVEWPSQVCNNNIPAADSTGERSTQYAAENSCRTRYAPQTEWLISFDTDEYIVPMGHHRSLHTMLQQAHDETDMRILSLRSSRGHLRVDQSFAVGSGRKRFPNTTFLQAYNCDSAGSPKPEWAERARKQVYQADYVLYHFVHYSTVTQGYMDRYIDSPTSYRVHFRDHAPTERTANEFTEAVLVHTKTVKYDQSTFLVCLLFCLVSCIGCVHVVCAYCHFGVVREQLWPLVALHCSIRNESAMELYLEMSCH